MEVMPCEFDDQNKCVNLYTNKDKTNILFDFDLLREKSQETYAEHIKVTAKQNGILYGSVIIRLSSMLEDFIKIKDFGVLVPRSKYNDICKVIEANYYLLQQNLVSSFEEELSKSVISGIFDMFCIYIAEQEITSCKNKKGNAFYNIPVENFVDYFKDSTYRQFDITKVKEKLLSEKYIHCNKGRLDNNVIDPSDSKQHKVISFDAQMVQSKAVALGIVKEII